MKTRFNFTMSAEPFDQRSWEFRAVETRQFITQTIYVNRFVEITPIQARLICQLATGGQS